jgi:hypothetical protein
LTSLAFISQCSTGSISKAIIVIRVFDEAGNVIGTHEQAGEFKEW